MNIPTGKLLSQPSKSQRILDKALTSFPFNLVFCCLFNEADALKHVSYIINPTLLHIKSLLGVINIHFFCRWILDKVYEALGKLPQAIINFIFLDSNDLIPVDVGMKNASPSLQNHTLGIRALVPWNYSRRQATDGNNRGLPKWYVQGGKCAWSRGGLGILWGLGLFRDWSLVLLLLILQSIWIPGSADSGLSDSLNYRLGMIDLRIKWNLRDFTWCCCVIEVLLSIVSLTRQLIFRR